MLAMLLAYDATGQVVATLDYVVARNDAGHPTGFIDFAAHEAANGEHTDIWIVSNAVGSKVWPEFIGGRAHDFTVELVGPPGAKRINALVHKASGFRRERAAIEAAIANVTPDPATGARDIGPIIGAPTRPLPLDDQGHTLPPQGGTPAHLPIIGGAG